MRRHQRRRQSARTRAPRRRTLMITWPPKSLKGRMRRSKRGLRRPTTKRLTRPPPPQRRRVFVVLTPKRPSPWLNPCCPSLPRTPHRFLSLSLSLARARAGSISLSYPCVEPVVHPVYPRMCFFTRMCSLSRICSEPACHPAYPYSNENVNHIAINDFISKIVVTKISHTSTLSILALAGLT